MHIPDGFLDLKTSLAAGGAAAAGVGLALARTQRAMPRRQVPLMGLSAAFVFAAQMLNFPIAGGTSGHLIGGTLAAVLLGPSAAVIVLTCVLIVQCFLFADGGLTSLGANIFNMAVLSPVVGYTLYRAVAKAWPTLRGRLAGVAFASWCTTVLAAISCAGQLALSGKAAWAVALPTMALVHAAIGVGEAVITTGVVYALWQARPEWRPAFSQGALEPIGMPQTGRAELLAYGLVVALGLACFVSPFASELPDGLEWIAGNKLHLEEAPTHAAPLADYQFAGLHWNFASKAIAGAVGVIGAFVFAVLLARGFTRREERP